MAANRGSEAAGANERVRAGPRTEEKALEGAGAPAANVGTKAARRARRLTSGRREADQGNGLATADRHGAGIRVIDSSASPLRQSLTNTWRHRAAFPYFMRRFLRKRYGRTFLGYLWFFLPTLIPLLTGALVFGGILGVSGGPVPYFLYFLIASSAWSVFSATAYFATRSLELSRSELRRVYVPRLIPLTAAMTMGLINLAVFAIIGVFAVAYYLIERGEFYLVLSPATALYPVGIAMLIVFGLACGLWFSPLAARARDVRRLAGYVLGFWYFLTPVLYPIDQISPSWRILASLNPVTAPLEMAKNGLIGTGGVTVTGIASYFVALALVASIGLYRFAAMERSTVARYY